MSVLLSAAAAARVEKSGNDLGDVCAMLSADRRYRGKGLPGDTRPGQLLPFKREALTAARRLLAKDKAVRAVYVLIRRSDDGSVELLRVGKLGAWKRVTRIWDRNGEPV